MTNTDKDNHIYEVGFLVAPIIPEEGVPADVAKIVAAIEGVKGSIIRRDEPEMRPLAYDMKKVIENKRHTFNSAYFGSIVFETDGEGVAQVKNILEKDENLVRFIIIRRSKESLEAPKKRVVAKKEEKMTEADMDKAIDTLVTE